MTPSNTQSSVGSIAKDIKVVITEKDTLQVNTHKKQTADRGKKYTGVKPANVGNRPLTLKEQKKGQNSQNTA